MQSFRSVFHAGVVGATLALGSAVQGQVTTSVEGFVGYYRPFGHFDPASVSVTGLPAKPSDLQGPAWGATVHLGVGQRVGFAAQLVTAHARIGEVVTPEGPRGPTNASVVLGSLVAQYDLSPNPRAYHVRVNAGPAFVHHGGDAYQPFGSPTSFGPALGTAVLVPLRAHLQLTAEATGLFYGFDLPMPPALRANSGHLEHGTQRDVLVHLGIAWTPP